MIAFTKKLLKLKKIKESNMNMKKLKNLKK